MAKRRRISFIGEESVASSFQDSKLTFEPSANELTEQGQKGTNESFRVWTEILKVQTTQKTELVTVEENPILKPEEKMADILALVGRRLEADPVIGVLENVRVSETADSKPEGNLTGDSSVVSVAVDAGVSMCAEVPGVAGSVRTEAERNRDGISAADVVGAGEIRSAEELRNETGARVVDDNIPVSVDCDLTGSDKQAEILTDESSKTRPGSVRRSKKLDTVHSKTRKGKNSSRTVSTSELSGADDRKEPGTRTRRSNSLSKCVRPADNQTINSSLGNDQQNASKHSKGRSLSGDVVEAEIRNPPSFAPSSDCKDTKSGSCEDDGGLRRRSLSVSRENYRRNEKKVEMGDSKEIFSRSLSVCVKRSLSSSKHETAKVPREVSNAKSKCSDEVSKREKKQTSKHEQSSKKVDDKSLIPKKQ